MLTDHYQMMARYNRWMNDKLYECAENLTEKKRREDLGAFFKSVHGTLNHILLADWLWMDRFYHGGFGSERLEGAPYLPTFNSLGEMLYEDFSELKDQRQKTDLVILNWIEGFKDGHWDKPFAYKNSKGIPRQHPFWQAVSHFFNHQTHHRGQVTTLFMQLGVDPGITDMIALFSNELER